jgi:periplasmic divalent cation tolerance protein
VVVKLNAPPLTPDAPGIVAETNTHHPYEVPSVIALPILDGSPTYLEWIRECTDPDT